MNSNMKTLAIAAVAATTSTALRAAVPEVSNVTMTQDDNRLVTIAYTLAEAPAVVTLDVQTNATANAATDDPGWTSIGGVAVCNAKGDVWQEVATGSHTITWRPDQSWPDHHVTDNRARAVVTAWALDNTPDYMVVDLATDNTVRYYPAVDFLPGSELGQTGTITNNAAYKTSKLVMRKIMAKDVEWTMGTAAGEKQRSAAWETPHVVSLANNYYIGVFEITQGQWSNIATNSARTANFTANGAMRPMENVTYNEIRETVATSATGNTTPNAAYYWPNDPNPASFLGLLRLKTGVDFELPSEAQWEFAARSGNGSGFWGNGSDVKNTSPDANLDNLARYLGDNPGGNANTATLMPSEGGTAVVGSYAPSSWGLYDMHGNVFEWCLDWHEADITSYGGAVNIDRSNPGVPLSGNPNNNTKSDYRVSRGGAWASGSGDCRAGAHSRGYHNAAGNNRGFRVVCTAGLQ